MTRHLYLLLAVIALFPGAVGIAKWLPEDEASLNYTQVLFSWDQMPGAMAYELEVSEDGGLPVINYIDSTLTRIINAELDWGLSYSWRVRPIFTDDIIGEWSSIRHFSILELPADRTTFSIENLVPDSVSLGLTILNANSQGFAMGVNQGGELKWYMDVPSLYPDTRFRITQFLPNGHFMLYRDDYGPGREVALDGTIHWQSNRADLHHEIIKMDVQGLNRYMGIVNRTVRALKYVTVSEDSSWNYYINWRGDDILEFDENGDVVWSWSTFDHFSMEDYSPPKLTGVGSGGTTDWTHSNAIYFDSSESAIYFSSRNISRITKIDYPSGEVIWMMGDSLASGDVTVGTDIGFSYQHSIKKLENGNLMMFDNGILTYRDGEYSFNERSRGLEIAVTSTDSGYTAEVVWQYVLPSNMYGKIMGDCDRLPNGNTMMTTGSSGYIVEATPDSQMVWYLDLGVKQIYRSERISNLYPQAHSVIGPDFTDSSGVRWIDSHALADSLKFEFINESWADQSYNYRLHTDGAVPDQTGQINVPPGARRFAMLPYVFEVPGEPLNLQWIVAQSSGSGMSDTVYYQIRHLNNPPRITSADSAFALEDSPFIYRATAVDAEDDTLIWTFPVLPSWLTAQADSVYGTPFEGTQDTTFTSIVFDGEFTDTLSIALLVLSSDDPPAITSADSAEATEDIAFVYHATAEDPDGPTLIWFFEDLPVWLAAADDSVYGTPLEGDGDTSFVVIAWDGLLGDTLEITVTVAAVNDPPQITSLPTARATEDTYFNYLAKATDPEGSTIDWTFDHLPSWLSDAADSVFGTPLEGTMDTSFRAIASDGILSDTLVVTLAVIAVNDAPEAFALVSPGHESTLAITGANLTDTLTFAWEGAVDVDGDTVHYGVELTDGLGFLLTFGDTTATEVRLPYAEVVAIMEGLGQLTLTGTWDIFASDGEIITWASNGPFTFSVDATTLDVFRQALLPQEFALHPNFPNPFNPSTTIRFDLPVATEVHLAVYDLLGREVAGLVDSYMARGYHRTQWNGRNRDGKEIPSSLYIARLVTPAYTSSIKMLLLK